MKLTALSAGPLAVALLSLSSTVAASGIWGGWMPEADALLLRRADATSTDSTTPAATTNANTATSTGGDSSSDAGTSTITGKTTAKTTSKKGNSTRTTFASTDSTGSVVIISPTSTSTTLYKIGDYVTFAWNYTNLKGSPTGIDVAVSCSLASESWVLTQNMSFAPTGRFTWDTKAFQSANVQSPLLVDYYTLQIYDAAEGVSATAKPGYLAAYTAGATFGMYTTQAYTPLGEWTCATCNGAFSPMERRFLGGAVAMSVLTVLTFTWFVAGVGAFV